jgi:hypothetical protein
LDGQWEKVEADCGTRVVYERPKSFDYRCPKPDDKITPEMIHMKMVRYYRGRIRNYDAPSSDFNFFCLIKDERCHLEQIIRFYSKNAQELKRFKDKYGRYEK